MLGERYQPQSRRTVLKQIGSAIAVGAVGVGGAGCISGTAKAQTDAAVNVSDRTIDMAEGETLEDVLLAGTVTGSYDASNIDAEVGKAAFIIIAEYEESEGPASCDYPRASDRIDVADVDPTQAIITRDVGLSLMDAECVPEWHWEPDYGVGRGEPALEWTVKVKFVVYDSEDNSIGADKDGDVSTVTIAWPEPDEDDSSGDNDTTTTDETGTFSASVSSDLTFEVVKG